MKILVTGVNSNVGHGMIARLLHGGIDHDDVLDSIEAALTDEGEKSIKALTCPYAI